MTTVNSSQSQILFQTTLDTPFLSTDVNLGGQQVTVTAWDGLSPRRAQ